MVYVLTVSEKGLQVVKKVTAAVDLIVEILMEKK